MRITFNNQITLLKSHRILGGLGNFRLIGTVSEQILPVWLARNLTLLVDTTMRMRLNKLVSFCCRTN